MSFFEVPEPDPEPVAGWAEQYRHIWDDRFDRMTDYVRGLQQQTDNPKDETSND